MNGSDTRSPRSLPDTGSLAAPEFSSAHPSSAEVRANLPSAPSIRNVPRSAACPPLAAPSNAADADELPAARLTFGSDGLIVEADGTDLPGEASGALLGRSIETCFATHIVNTMRIAANAREHIPSTRERGIYRLANVRFGPDSRRVDLVVDHHGENGRRLTTVEVRDAGALGGSGEILQRLARFSTLARLAPVGILQLAADGSCLYANAKWTALSRLSSERSEGFGWIDAIHPDEVDEIVGTMHRGLARDHVFRRELRLRSPEGSIVWVAVEMTALIGSNGTVDGSLLVASDVTENRGLVERLHDLAHKDTLTGLWNRAAWLDTLDRRAGVDEDGGRLGVLYIDLDGFKAINDTVGHDHGDELLKAVAERLSAAVRPEDMLARLGGDEFAVVMPGLANEEAAAAVARRIVDTVAQPFTVFGKELGVGASVGIALADGPELDRTALVKRADTALYAAKHAGRSRYVFYSSEQDRAQRERSALVVAVRRAVERMNFTVRYQPQIDFAADRVVGFEALLRIGAEAVPTAIDTGTLVEILEDTGLIDPVGRWVLDEACRQFAEWCGLPGLHPTATVSVNVSARQLGNPTFVDEVARTLERHALSPDRLVLEITESVLVGTHDSDVIARLKALGVGIALDDFGKGYSSLAYLGKLPLDRLKIDRSFVDGLTTSPEARKIVSCIVSLACSLGVRVTAEGIEDVATRDLLHDKGCHDWQGYLYSRPVEPTRVEELLVLEHHRRRGPVERVANADGSRSWLDESVGTRHAG